MKIGNSFQMLAIFAKRSILNDDRVLNAPLIKLFKVNDKKKLVVVRLNQIMSKLLILSKF